MAKPRFEKIEQDEQTLGYTRCPRDIFAMGFSGAQALISAQVYSASNVKKAPSARCKMSQAKIGNLTGTSRATVNRTIRRLKTIDGFEVFNQNEEGARYYSLQYALHIPGDRRRIEIPNYLIYQKFDMKDGKEPRVLSHLERLIIALFLTNEGNPHADVITVKADDNKVMKFFLGSPESMARMLNQTSEKAVRRALNNLIRADIVHRPFKGTSKHNKSKYVVDSSLARIIRKYTKAQRKEEQAQEQQEKTVVVIKEGQRLSEEQEKQLAMQRKYIEACDQRAAFDRHYAQKRARAQAIADRNIVRARADGDYSTVERSLRALSLPIAKAEVTNDKEAFIKLSEEARRLEARSKAILARLGLTEDDLHPKFTCKKCEDTGYRRSDGQVCGCYKPPRPQAAQEAEKEPVGN